MTCVCKQLFHGCRHKQNIKAAICQNKKCEFGFMVSKCTASKYHSQGLNLNLVTMLQGYNGGLCVFNNLVCNK